MAKYEALTSFIGVIAGTQGEIFEIKDKEIAKDLLQAGYIKEVKSQPKKEAKK